MGLPSGVGPWGLSLLRVVLQNTDWMVLFGWCRSGPSLEHHW